MQCEALTHNDLGLIALNEESEESAREAVLHFEKYLFLSKAIDFNVGIVNAEYNIAYAKSKYDETSDIFEQEEEQLKKARDLYDLRVAKHGEGHTLALHEGINLCMSLWRTNRASEAERMLARLATVSKRIHGSQHKLTKKIEAELHDFKARDEFLKSSPTCLVRNISMIQLMICVPTPLTNAREKTFALDSNCQRQWVLRDLLLYCWHYARDGRIMISCRINLLSVTHL